MGLAVLQLRDIHPRAEDPDVMVNAVTVTKPMMMTVESDILASEKGSHPSKS